MKKIILIALIFTLLGCKSSRINTALNTLDEKRVVDITNCAENATCSIEIIPKSNLIVKSDEFKNTYIEIEKGEHTIIKFEFKKNKLPDAVDSNYSEILYLEIDNYNKTLILKDKELEQVKMVYGRLCYCKGSSGYFEVKKGNLKLILKKNELTLNADFSVENIPQIITQIHQEISLKQ